MSNPDLDELFTPSSPERKGTQSLTRGKKNTRTPIVLPPRVLASLRTDIREVGILPYHHDGDGDGSDSDDDDDDDDDDDITDFGELLETASHFIIVLTTPR